MNIGILIAVTRIISRISAENYKVHGDSNALKWVPLMFIFSRKCCVTTQLYSEFPIFVSEFMELWYGLWYQSYHTAISFHGFHGYLSTNWDVLVSPIYTANCSALNIYSTVRTSLWYSYLVMAVAYLLRLTAKAVAVLLPILGISWIFGVLAINDQSLLFQYMFSVFNSLQVRLTVQQFFFHRYIFYKYSYFTADALMITCTICHRGVMFG